MLKSKNLNMVFADKILFCYSWKKYCDNTKILARIDILNIVRRILEYLLDIILHHDSIYSKHSNNHVQNVMKELKMENN